MAQPCRQCGGPKDRGVQGARLCTQCKNLPCPNHPERKQQKGGLCASCYHYKTYPDRRALTLRWYYRLTREEYDRLLAEQHHRCAICGSPEPGAENWNIDHDHYCCSGDGRRTCGKCVRGIVCASCNRALGLIADSPLIAIAMAGYLLQYYLKRQNEAFPGSLNGKAADC